MKRFHVHHSNRRSGATLVEVLMSLMIFSIAITLVISLFPISILTAIRANQLTNSKVLAENVVEQVRINPLLLRPGFDELTFNWQGTWVRGRVYNIGDVIWPTISTGQLYPTPNLLYRCTQQGTSGFVEPNWIDNSASNQIATDIADGPAPNPVTWRAIPLTVDNANYVIDPLGRLYDSTISGIRRFGSPDGFNGVANGLFRTNPGFVNFMAASSVFTQSDSWTTLVEAVPVSMTPNPPTPTIVPPATVTTTVTFPIETDLMNLNAMDNRVVLVSAGTSRKTLVRGISVAPNNQTVTLSGDQPLPPSFDEINELSTVRIENFTPRYSYLMTVRRTDPFVAPTISVVILFSRSFSLLDEQIFNANFGNSQYNDPGAPATIKDPNLGVDQVKISWANFDKPLLREGNFIFDARNAIWYQMADISADDVNEWALITLTEAVHVQTPVPMGSQTTADTIGRAIFLPGIVDIFEL